MPIIFVPLQYNNNISNNKNIDIMSLKDKIQFVLKSFQESNWTIVLESNYVWVCPDVTCVFVSQVIVSSLSKLNGLELLGFDFVKNGFMFHFVDFNNVNE